MFLTHDEVTYLTGYKRPSAQIRWLRENGFNFRVAADGHSRVERAHCQAMMGTANRTARRAEPNFQGCRKRA
jgi:hypothetical protein